MIVYDRPTGALMKVTQGFDPDSEAQKAGFTNYKIMTKDEWHASPEKLSLKVTRKRDFLRAQIEEEAARRIESVSQGVKGFSEGLAVAALTLPTSLNTDGLKVRSIALYAKQKIADLKAAADSEVMRYNPRTDQNWP